MPLKSLLTRDSLDRAVNALERIADALDRAIPPIPPEELQQHKLEERDYAPSNNSSRYEDEIFDMIKEHEGGNITTEQEDRIRRFIHEQLDFQSKA